MKNNKHIKNFKPWDCNSKLYEFSNEKNIIEHYKISCFNKLKWRWINDSLYGFYIKKRIMSKIYTNKFITHFGKWFHIHSSKNSKSYYFGSYDDTITHYKHLKYTTYIVRDNKDYSYGFFIKKQIYNKN